MFHGWNCQPPKIYFIYNNDKSTEEDKTMTVARVLSFLQANDESVTLVGVMEVLIT